jgi:hypothetical protein
MDTRLESMGRRVVDQNTSQLEEIHHEIVSCFLPRAKYELGFKADTTDHSTRLVDYHNSSWKNCNRLRENYLEERIFLKERGKQFIREGLMQDAMYDANMVHAW